jgi:hypothetical protein
MGSTAGIAEKGLDQTAVELVLAQGQGDHCMLKIKKPNILVIWGAGICLPARLAKQVDSQHSITRSSNNRHRILG